MKRRMRQPGSGTTGLKSCSLHRRNGTGRRSRSINETKMKVKGTWYFFWAAVDTENGELLGIALTPTRDGHDASRSIRRMLRACTNTPTVLVDGGPWYSWALSRMGVPWMGACDVREAECG